MKMKKQNKPIVLIPSPPPKERPSDFEILLGDIAEIRYVSPSDKQEFEKTLKEAEAMIVWGVTGEEVLSKAPKLKVISRIGVGYDSIDVDACNKYQVYVTITPGVVSNAVAELTIGLMLSLSRKIKMCDEFVRTKWAMPNTFMFPMGSDLAGKILGIIGLGRIGYEVAARAKAFKMNLIYYDKVRNEKAEKKLDLKYVNFEDLLKISDFVTIHVPLTKETTCMIGEKELKLMKKTAYLINTSRGSVINEKALCKALEEGWIAGAGLDVFETEPLPLDSPLIKNENTVLTPHVGTATYETRHLMALSVTNSIREVLSGKVPTNVVPEQRCKVFKK
ncbi:D-glycerate dehydrogenase [Candidatus Bathyarchaeota archaeon]|nr:D-glycerate dehydrogenase [Candidatus Bathyarchaeota archaeon]